VIPDEILRSVQAIHDAPPRLVYAFAGAGSLALHWLHAAAGSSRTVLEAVDAYAPRSLAGLLGGQPAQAVSAATARGMAAWAAARARALAEGDWPLVGVGLTAAIATDRARRGADRAFVAVSAGGAVTVYALTMVKGARARAEQEELVSRLLLLVLAGVCGAPEPELALLPGETVEACR
jgi:hypothetical protein